MSFPENKYDHHRLEAIIHTGFIESLDRCSTETSADFDTPEFVQCMKASAINYTTFAHNWNRYKNSTLATRKIF